MLAIVLLSVLFAIALVYPPLALAIYCLTSGIEAYGICEFLNGIGLQNFTWFSSAPVVLASLVAFYRIYKVRGNNIAYSRLWMLACMLMFCLIWVGMGSAVKYGPQALGTISANVVYAGFPIALVGLAYFRSPLARKLFVGVLVFHLTLAVGVILFPNSPLKHFRHIDTSLMQGTAPVMDNEYHGGIARVGTESRLCAHFADSGSYGFCAVIGVAVGLILFLPPQMACTRLLGVISLASGVFGCSVTYYRGSTIGLVIGCCIIVFSIYRRVNLSGKLIGLLLVSGLLIIIFMTSMNFLSHMFSPFAVSTNDEGIIVRVAALQNAVSIMTQHPFFGMVSASELYRTKDAALQAHQIMIYYASANGIAVGLCVTFFMAVIVLGSINYVGSILKHDRGGGAIALRRGYVPCRSLAILLGWVCFGTSLLNNMSSPLVFWVCWAEACSPWIFGTLEKSPWVQEQNPARKT
jgi:hypothetical protein